MKMQRATFTFEREYISCGTCPMFLSIAGISRFCMATGRTISVVSEKYCPLVIETIKEQETKK